MVDYRTAAVDDGHGAPEPGGHYDVYRDPYPDPYDAATHDETVAAPAAGRSQAGALGGARLRADFGAHFEANYQRLVAQLYAITLNSGEAHDVVQDAYSRAWRQWAAIGRLRDPADWIRRVAVRSTLRSWRRTVFGIGRPRPVGEVADPRTAALLAALSRLSAAERRVVVLHHMVGWTPAQIAVVERSAPGSVGVRLARASQVVADALPEAYGPYADEDEERFR